MIHLLKKILFLFIFFSFVHHLYSQKIGDASAVVVDTSGISSFKKVFRGQPGKAALYSLIIPGGGQVYNKKWWKVPLAVGLDGVALYYVIYNSNNFKDWNQCYLDIVQNSSTDACISSQINRSTAFSIRNTFKRNRDLSFILLGVAHLLQCVDAYVDRHLMNFDIDDNLSFRISGINESHINIFTIKIPIK